MFKRSAAFAAVCVPVWLMCCVSIVPADPGAAGLPATRPADPGLPPASAGVWTAMAAVACFAEPVRRTLADEDPPWRPSSASRS